MISYLVQLIFEVEPDEYQGIQTIVKGKKQLSALLAHLPDNVDVEEITNLGYVSDFEMLLKDFYNTINDFDPDLELG